MAVQTTYEFIIKPQGEIIADYMYSRGRNTFLMGPLGSGKTYASCMRIFDQMCEQEPNVNNVRKSRWIAIRNTYPDLNGTTIKDWCDLYHNEDMSLGKFNKDFPPTHYLDFDLEDGTRVKAELVFMALDRPQAVKKLRGIQATGFWLNEMKWGDNSMLSKAEFTQVEEQKMLVWNHSSADENWNIVPNPMMPDWPTTLLTTVTFVDVGDKTKVRLVWTPVNASEAEIACFAGSMNKMGGGWESGYAIIDEILAEL